MFAYEIVAVSKDKSNKFNRFFQRKKRGESKVTSQQATRNPLVKQGCTSHAGVWWTLTNEYRSFQWCARMPPFYKTTSKRRKKFFRYLDVTKDLSFYIGGAGELEISVNSIQAIKILRIYKTGLQLCPKQEKEKKS